MTSISHNYPGVTGIGLLSGGLDSMLAVALLKEQGITTVGVCFVTPFFGNKKAKKAADFFGIELISIDISEQYLPLLDKPQYGFGKNMNPCIDCHGLMFKTAGRVMEERGADFLFSGEVLGERPKSQMFNCLRSVEKLSGYPGLVLRPLSAKLLPPTIPEQDGRIDRSQLLDIQGRRRHRQFELAEKYGIDDIPPPGGGCLLTDPAYSQKLRTYLEMADGKPLVRDIGMLKTGRHFIEDGWRIIVGRNEKENTTLTELADSAYYVIETETAPGPTVLVKKDAPQAVIEKAKALCVRYSDAGEGEAVQLSMR